MPNGIRDRFVTHHRMQWIAMILVKNETTTPTIPIDGGGNDTVPIHQSRATSMDAPAIIGAARRKEKSTASFLFRPQRYPAAIVNPERDNPGSNAKACAIPITRAARHRTVIPPRGSLCQ